MSAVSEYWAALGGRALEPPASPPPAHRYLAAQPPEPPPFRFEGAGLRAYFRPCGAFSWRSRSQLELALEGEPEPPPEQLQQRRLVHQLRGQLRPDVRFRPERRPPPPPPPEPLHPSPPDLGELCEPPDPPPASFISKLMGAKRARGTRDERERLVSSSDRKCQIVASSDNFFKTDFGGADSENDFSAPRSVSGLDEARAPPTNGGGRDRFDVVGESDAPPGEDPHCGGGPSPSSSTLMLPKTGYDFLDDW